MKRPATDVLGLWGELAANVALMRELARCGRWERLPELDAHCLALVRQLEGMRADHLGPGERAGALALALQVRTDQEAVKDLTLPQFTALFGRMGAMGRLVPP